MTTNYQQQNETGTGEAPMSAALAKRIAEAADSLRDNNIYYFVSRKKFPFDLMAFGGTQDIAKALADAQEELAKKNAEISEHKDMYVLSGPFKTDGEHSFTKDLDYEAAELCFTKTVNGVKTLVKTFAIDKSTDAIILSLSAFDKFFLPYYTRLLGADEALKLRNMVKEDILSEPTEHRGTTNGGIVTEPLTYPNRYHH